MKTAFLGRNRVLKHRFHSPIYDLAFDAESYVKKQNFFDISALILYIICVRRVVE